MKRENQTLMQSRVQRRNGLSYRPTSSKRGAIDTPMLKHERETSGNADETTKAFCEMAVHRRVGKPEEVANVTAFLLSEEAFYLTGADILVDGGVIAMLKSG